MPTPIDKALNSKVLLLLELVPITILTSTAEHISWYISILQTQSEVIQILTFKAFTGIVTAAAAWSIWGQDMFPKENDPSGGTFYFYCWLLFN